VPDEGAMIIKGLQKLTLLDYPGKVACTVFTAGCNFRCPFCHNASLVTGDFSGASIPCADIIDFLALRKGILQGVCVTGGEPLLQNDLEGFLTSIKEMGLLIKLDTNGSFPQKLKSLIEKNLIDMVAMDIKNSKENYARTAGVKDLDITPIEESVRILMNGNISYEFRTTIVREFHQKSDLISIGEWIRGADKYFLQHFKDSGDLLSQGLHGYDKSVMTSALSVVSPYVKEAKLRGI
jgi:pyruvate formate lyase activating enzyme